MPRNSWNVFSLTCPKCGDEVHRVNRRNVNGEYYRCQHCGEVFIRVGNVLVSAVPEEFDLDGTRWSRLDHTVRQNTDG
jgi:DNA-directed RNA polymerase subunit RPC12/RpoP